MSRQLALGLLLSALLGGTAAALVVLAVGHAGSTRSVTTVVRETGRRPATGMDARAIYSAVAAGVVDISTRARSDEGGLFGPNETTASGSGFVIDSSGRILTAEHVVENATTIVVGFEDGASATAEVLGSDPSSDVALLKVDPGKLSLHPLPLGTTKALAAGDQLAVVGDPFRYARSLSTGVVSALDRSIEAPNGYVVSHAIQTDAALNPGNSGGPVLDARGRVVGIADQIASGGTGTSSYTGVGFAVPIDIVRSELPQLAKGQAVKHSYLGIGTAPGGDSAGLAGALVQEVEAGSPAAAGGLQGGDVIVALDGARVLGASDIVAGIAARRPGERIRLSVLRGSRRLDLIATLGVQPPR